MMSWSKRTNFTEKYNITETVCLSKQNENSDVHFQNLIKKYIYLNGKFK